MQFLRKFLLPFSLLYGFATLLRNKLFDWNVLPSVAFEKTLVVVGNLNTGGTGKTPMTEFLVENLQKDRKIAVLSRGYGRQTKGFVLADRHSDASSLGDEPFQIHQKFPEIVVAVDADRRQGVRHILSRYPDVDTILLDDAFQHRYVQPKMSILLTSYGDLYVDDCLLPAGNLRESGRGAARADVIVVTKCPPQLSEAEKSGIAKKIALLPHQKLFFSTITYANFARNHQAEVLLSSFLGKQVCLVTGIANPKPLVTYLKSQNIDFEHLKFPDHHRFGEDDMALLNQKACILTTEKDFVRLDKKLQTACYYLPISVSFLDDETAFIREILNKILV
ncbi:MAG: tetraacyldisaccharide 4'-kinase [Flavobacteriaceae bacterium]|nr:tetraacyldisaccharide 4'-kinase [Flavobacteriaceae bacterium]